MTTADVNRPLHDARELRTQRARILHHNMSLELSTFRMNKLSLWSYVNVRRLFSPQKERKLHEGSIVAGRYETLQPSSSTFIWETVCPVHVINTTGGATDNRTSNHGTWVPPSAVV